MSFTWGSILDLAKHLVAVHPSEMQADEEAYYRASVGRAYYACHTSIKDWLEDNTAYQRNTNNGVHQDVIDAVTTFIDTGTSHRISRRLDSLRGERIQADYILIPLSGNWDKRRAEVAIGDAEYILDELSRSVAKV